MNNDINKKFFSLFIFFLQIVNESRHFLEVFFILWIYRGRSHVTSADINLTPTSLLRKKRQNKPSKGIYFDA